MKVGQRQQQGRYEKKKEVCPICNKYYLQSCYGNTGGVKLKIIGKFCPECDYIRKIEV